MAFQTTSTDKTLERMRSNPNPTLGDRARASERAMNPEVHGLLNALVGLPGLRLRKMSDIPDVVDPKTQQTVKPGESGGLVFDFYSPFTEQPRPDEYSSLEEQLAYKGGEGRGELLNAATLLPGLGRRTGRMALEGVGKLKANEAKGAMQQAAQSAGDAAEWMSPRVNPGTSGPALLGEEAMQLANESAARMQTAKTAASEAEQFINNAKNWGSSADGAISKLDNAMFVRRPLLAAGSSLLNGAAGSVESELGQQPVETLPMTTVGPQQTQTSGPAASSRPAAPAPTGESVRAILAGRQQPTAWQRPERNFITRAADFLNQRHGWERDQSLATQHLDNQMKQLGFVDPETEFRMQQAGADAALGRAKDLSRDQAQVTGNTPGQQFAGRFAPAMDVQQLEQMYGLPAGSINPELIRRMGAEKEISPMDLMMMQMLQNMNLGPGPQGKFNNAPKLNAPPAR